MASGMMLWRPCQADGIEKSRPTQACTSLQSSGLYVIGAIGEWSRDRSRCASTSAMDRQTERVQAYSSTTFLHRRSIAAYLQPCMPCSSNIANALMRHYPKQIKQILPRQVIPKPLPAASHQTLKLLCISASLPASGAVEASRPACQQSLVIR